MSNKTEILKPIAKVKKQKQSRARRLPETFAYMHDETGLVLPHPSFPPVPSSLNENLANEVQCRLRHLMRPLRDEDAAVAWSMSPYLESALIFRKWLLEASSSHNRHFVGFLPGDFFACSASQPGTTTTTADARNTSRGGAVT